MILGFKEYFDTKKTQPTYFREKILINDSELALFIIPDHPDFIPKLHTIREDKHNRWKPGMSIQMVYRGPKYSIKSHFNKGIDELQKCKSTQKIEIRWFFYNDKRHQVKTSVMSVKIDGKDFYDINRLAANDGFSSKEEFMNYFNKKFTGKILHWTDLRY